jgi:DNA-binding transcriptional LysR family regulator
MRATIDLNNVEVFVRVVELQGFTAAARQLGLPKSTVSRRVAVLEEALGVRLLQRTTRKLSLTDAGLTFYDHASRGLGALSLGAAAAAELQGAPRGTLRITAPVDLGGNFVAELVARFVRSHPDIRVEVELSSRLVDLVAEGFDLAIRAGRMRDSTLVSRRLGEIAAVLSASPAYLRRRPAPTTVPQLAEHDCLLFRQSSKARWSLEGPEGVEEVDVTGPISADDFSFIHRATLAGAGISLLPYPSAAADLEQGRLVRVLPGYKAPNGTLHMVWPSSSHLPRKVGLFRDFVLEHLRLPLQSEGAAPPVAESTPLAPAIVPADAVAAPRRVTSRK